MLVLAAVGADPSLHSPRESSRSRPRELLPLSAHATARAKRPNLVITLVDDVGYNDVGWHNSDVKTPFLDSLIHSDSEPTVELMRHYAFSVCSPTRASLLTGRLPAHVNQINGGSDFPATDELIAGMDLRMRTLPQLLGEAGYSTAHVGKWHLGSSQMAHLPSRRGFHESFAFLSGSMHTHLTHMIQPAGPNLTKEEKRWEKRCGNPGYDLWENEMPIYEHEGVHSCELFATRAVDMIARHDLNKPLFLYVALPEGHGPYDEVPRHSAAAISCSENTPDCVKQRHYRGMIACADEATRNITEALQRQNMWKDTLMVWSSDNGAKTDVGSNAPFRGYKSQMLEGGVRVVAVLAGGALPATAPPKFEGIVHVADWFATFAALAGIDDPSDPDAVRQGLPDIDSINMWPYLTGENGDDGPSSGRTELLLGTGMPGPILGGCFTAALIQGHWKIVSRVNIDSPAPQDRPHKHQAPQGILAACSSAEDFALFNLAEDPYEERPYLYDTSSEGSGHANKLEELVGRFRELAADAYQTGVTGGAYAYPGEAMLAPLAAACSVAQAAHVAHVAARAALPLV